jgi:hypothetical protein
LPEEIGHKRVKLHPDPKAFWCGQFIAYILRNRLIDEVMKNATEKLGPKLYVGSL